MRSVCVAAIGVVVLNVFACAPSSNDSERAEPVASTLPCYAVRSLEPRVRNRPVDLDERGRVLVQALNPTVPFVWDNVRFDLGTPPGAESPFVDAMNESGEIVGQAFLPAIMTSRPFVWRDRVPVEIVLEGWAPSPIAWEHGPLLISDTGHIAGTFQRADGEVHAFLLRAAGTVVDLGLGSARALNDAGVVAGVDGDGAVVVWDGALKREIGPGTDLGLGPLSINARGDVAGNLRPTVFTQVRAFFWRDGVTTDLGRGVATGLNDRGEVIVNRDSGAFVWRDGTIRSLGETTRATDISEAGRVVGSIDVAGVRRPFLWSDGARIVLPVGAHGDVFVGASRINESGVVVGYAEHYSSGDQSPIGTRTLLWSPEECTGEEPTE